MNTSWLLCSRCQAPLDEGRFRPGELAPCPSCAAPLQVEVFPAFFRPAPAGRTGEAILIEGESSCFYHPQKKAVLPCQGCGRFLCALCDCELHGEHFCPACLETGRKKGKIKRLENERTLYDSIALSLAVVPMLLFYFTFITAPAAIYYAIRYWNAPRSIVHRTRARLVVAIVLAGLQIAGWCLGIYAVFHAKHRIPHG
jgi:hypothetical protein